MISNARALAALPLILTLAAGCAHAPTAPTLTSAQAPAPAPAPAPQVAPPVAAPAEEAAPKPKKAEPHALSFEELSAQLGADDKVALDSTNVGDGSTVARAGRGLSADGYTAVGATHQAVPGAMESQGDVKVSGGLTVVQVRGVVHEASDRLRRCYERGLQETPHLAGDVRVSFSVDAKGAVSGVDAETDSLPSAVTACVAGVFESMSFPAPKAPPAKVAYPVEFRHE